MDRNEPIQAAAAAPSVADAAPDNWVDAYAPPWAQPYLRLSRADRPTPVWLLLLPCWQSLALAAAADGWRWSDAWLAVAFAMGAVLMRGAGCAWNDVTDRDIDGAVERTRSRPIPSGQITPRQAVAWCAAQCLAAFLILITFNTTTIALGVASLGLVAIYPLMKRVTWWPQVFLGLAFNFGALVGWSAHTGDVGWPAALLYLGGVAWTLHYDTIYAHQDRHDDALIGVKSTARLFGADSARWLVGFAAAAAALTAAAATAALSGPALTAALLGVTAFGAHLARQILALDIDDPGCCRRLFLSNRGAGLIVLAGFLAASTL